MAIAEWQLWRLELELTVRGLTAACRTRGRDTDGTLLGPMILSNLEEALLIR